jgi:signal transduction histidine kinase
VRARAQRDGAEIVVDVNESLPYAFGDRVQVQQALLNLFVNALDDDHRIRLAVSDTGRGIDASDENAIFNPFYSTKRDGLGLGLVVSRSIAQAHGGRLWVTRNEGPGVTFWMTLPVAEKKG